jgi:EAL domain-containing protein (putative c-di-GMP-specific phosphodiesterase class I)
MRGERGELIAPAAFLPTAERYGLITQIDAWMLARALEFVADGRAVNLNLSGRTLEEGRYVETIERHADTCDLSLLTIEITETSHVSDLAGVRDSAHRLAGLGCGLTLDDFGTGYATLSYLKHLPIACIKIDREFIEHLATDPRDQRIVEALVGIARAADQQTVAEGVENAEALELLRRLGVDHAQGYFIGRPAPAERTPPPDSEVDLAQADGEGDGVHAGVGVELAHRVADMGANGLR